MPVLLSFGRARHLRYVRKMITLQIIARNVPIAWMQADIAIEADGGFIVLVGLIVRVGCHQFGFDGPDRIRVLSFDFFEFPLYP